jgi:hypothetical protein
MYYLDTNDCGDFYPAEHEEDCGKRRLQIRRHRLKAEGAKTTGIKFLRFDHCDGSEHLIRLGDVEQVEKERCEKRSESGGKVITYSVHIKIIGDEESNYGVGGYHEDFDILDWVREHTVFV